MTRLQVSTLLLSGALALLTVVQPVALAGRWEARQEAREGYREVQRERREARREIRRCQTRDCARREIREGYREVQREKREARREIRRDLRDHRWRPYSHGGWHDSRDDDNLLRGVAIGAAVVGIGAAIANSAQDEY